MKSGTSRFPRCGSVFFFVVAVFFVFVSGVFINAAAQQPASNAQAGQSVPPAEAPAVLPGAQPLSQAATSASGAAPAKTHDAAKDSPDQSASVKLGPGDLLEVS